MASTACYELHLNNAIIYINLVLYIIFVILVVAVALAVGGDEKHLGQMPIKLTHASGNACISRCSDASGNACISRHSIHTLAADGPKKEVRLVLDVAVRAPSG
jgi:hypothetical protein